MTAHTWVTNLWHFLDEDTGDLTGLPAPALNRRIFFASIVAWVKSSPGSNLVRQAFCGTARCAVNRASSAAHSGTGAAVLSVTGRPRVTD